MQDITVIVTETKANENKKSYKSFHKKNCKNFCTKSLFTTTKTYNMKSVLVFGKERNNTE